VTDRHKKKCVGVFLVKIFGKERASERRNENIIVSGTLIISAKFYYKFKKNIYFGIVEF